MKTDLEANFRIVIVPLVKIGAKVRNCNYVVYLTQQGLKHVSAWHKEDIGK